MAFNTKAVDERPHYVGVASLSVFGGNFVLAMVRRGPIGVRLELRGVRFSEIRNESIGGQVRRLSAFRSVRYYDITSYPGLLIMH